MSLQPRLNAIKKSFREQAGPEMTALLDRTTQALIDSGQAERALGVGAEFPEFALPDTNGGSVRFSDARDGAAAVVTFYRGKWWPYCRSELDALNRIVPGLGEAGAKLFAITPQIVAINKEQVDERGFPFPLLRDEGNVFAATLGLAHTLPDDLKAAYLQFGIDLAASNGDESWTLPMPARYIVDANGIVRHASVHPDYTTRPEPDETLELVRALSN